MNSRITIKDIARAFGCSANCVSRALMDAPDISETTKQKIRALADEMGYVYNRHAATLRAGKSRTVGILFDSLLNPFYYIMTNYVWERLSREGYSIVTYKSDNAVFEPDLVRTLLSETLGGLLSFVQPSAAAYAQMTQNALPTVVIGRKTHGMCDCVYLDDIKGGRLAAKHFLDMGCTRPLYVGEPQTLDCSSERAQGFKEQFLSYGIQAELAFIDSPSRFKFDEFVTKRVSEGNSPDCIFCFSDFAAYEVITALGRLKKNIPVVGYDNIQNEIALPFALKSVGYDKKAMVDCAVDLLLAKIADGNTSVPETSIDVWL